MKRVPCASVIVENKVGEVLLLLRDNKSTTVFPNHWTLISGNVGANETPEMAAQRELEETGLTSTLCFWKRYDREHPLFVVDQHIYTAKVDADIAAFSLMKGQALQFFKPEEIGHLKIGYGFKALLHEYFLMTIRNLDVHHS